MKSLYQFITEAKSPRGIRGYVALVDTGKGQEIVQMPYEATPEEAWEKYSSKNRFKDAKIVEGPFLLTLKGYKWYDHDYEQNWKYYGDNGYLSGNYDVKQPSAEEAWKTLTDPANKYIKK